MSELITLINYIAVSIFGSILSAAFCGIGKEKKQRNLIVFTVGVALIIEGIVYYFYGERVVHEFYPVFAHIPLVIVLWVITKRFFEQSIFGADCLFVLSVQEVAGTFVYICL